MALATPHAGDLELRPLPAVLLDLHDAKATGRFLVQEIGRAHV